MSAGQAELPITTDVLIIGAGPAGASAALFLAKKGINSVILEKEKFPRDKICGDALSGKTVEVLNKLDKNLVAELSANKKFLGSWGVTFVAPNGQALRVPFQTKKEKKNAPGFISKRIDFDNWLAEKAKATTGIKLYEESEVRRYKREEGYILAEAKNGKVFKSKLVIACDGAYSSFAKSIGGLITEPPHNCFGLRAYYKNVKGLDTENFIELHFLKEFLPGYFWIFPLPDGGANVGVGMRADKMTAKKINLKKSFESILSNNPIMRERFAGAE
ncbi:MAG: FAD-dependent monooxygenase, partial [Chitinophagales bacterium]|nr:FAD-dependent monooxygenase [Chitinophagales bacterium]